MGGTFAAIFTTLYPRRPSGLVLLEAPLHFGSEVGDLDRLIARSPRASLLTTGTNTVPGTVLDIAGVTASPGSFWWSRAVDAWASLADPLAFRVHAGVERRALDEMPMPRQLFEEGMELLYRQDGFMRRTLRIHDRIADPRRLTAPVLSVVGRGSRVVSPAAVLPFHAAVSSAEKSILWYEGERGVGLPHARVLVGPRAHRRVWPRILRWITAHCGSHRARAPAD